MCESPCKESKASYVILALGIFISAVVLAACLAAMWHMTMSYADQPNHFLTTS